MKYPNKFTLTLKENLFLAKKVLVAQIHHLSRFEDCKTTLLQTEQIINGQNVASVSLGDIQTILHLKRGYLYVLQHVLDGKAVDISLLKKINGIVAQEDSLAAGEFRTGSVGVTLFDGSRHTPKPMTEQEIDILFQQIKNQSHSNTEIAIRSMLAFMRNQIFWDGNKRTATLFANAMMMAGGCGVLEISEQILPQFNEKLSSFYQSANDCELMDFLYHNCIYGIEY
ncbi:MAG: Fic family protein [Neisseria sp.]|nr:Fic family protein [Neisseria sp.]